MKVELIEVSPDRRKWMCHVVGGGIPVRVHDTLASATTEAARLCEVTGKLVFILESIGHARPKCVRGKLKQEAAQTA